MYTCKIRGEAIVLEHSPHWPFGFIISNKTFNMLLFKMKRGLGKRKLDLQFVTGQGKDQISMVEE